MPNIISRSLRTGVKSIREHPQFLYTFIVGVVIFFLFIFTADRFARIALDAQERLVNVRTGSILDTFVVFGGHYIDNDNEALEHAVFRIVADNETIKELLVLKSESDSQWSVSAAHDRGLIGMYSLRSDEEFLIRLATSDPDNGFTIEDTDNQGRLLRTVRAIKGDTGDVVAVVLISQTLSEADRQVNESIRNSFLILISILLILFLLFFRHARIIDYTELYRKLKAIDQMKDDFTSMVSHELRTPLTAIRGYADLLEGLDTLDKSAKEYAHRIALSSERLEKLVTDMLDVSRIQQGKLALTPRNTHPNKIIKDVVDFLQPHAEKKGLSLVYEDKESPTLFVDEDRLRQVLINIIGNAIKYTERGEVRIETNIRRNKLEIRISDTGTGLTAEERKALFKKFSRVNNASANTVKGSGLGLWISTALTRLMGGSLTVESIKNVGSHFVLEFPLLER